MAGQTTVLQRRKRCDHGLSITTNGGLLECLRCLVCFLVMALELAHIGADKTQDAHFFYQGRLWVIRNQRRESSHHFPVLAGNAVCNALHVFAQVLHDLAECQRLGLFNIISPYLRADACQERADDCGCKNDLNRYRCCMELPLKSLIRVFERVFRTFSAPCALLEFDTQCDGAVSMIRGLLLDFS